MISRGSLKAEGDPKPSSERDQILEFIHPIVPDISETRRRRRHTGHSPVD